MMMGVRCRSCDRLVPSQIIRLPLTALQSLLQRFLTPLSYHYRTPTGPTPITTTPTTTPPTTQTPNIITPTAPTVPTSPLRCTAVPAAVPPLYCNRYRLCKSTSEPSYLDWADYSTAGPRDQVGIFSTYQDKIV